MNQSFMTTANVVKTCFRCGNEFQTNEQGRVCWRCRKPRHAPPNLANKQLTFREAQIVDLVAQGKANKEIAFHLILTEGTIKEYLNRIFRKVEVSNRTELAVWALTKKATSDRNTYERQSSFDKRSLVI